MSRPLAKAGGAAICTCMLAAGVLVVAEVPSPPRPARPAVALAALPRPFTATVPDLVERVGTFAMLVDPLVTDGGRTRKTTAALAQPGGTAAVAQPVTTASGPVSYAFTQIVNAVVKGVLTLVAPAMNNPTLAPIVGPALLFGGILAGLVVGTVYTVIVGIENAVGGVVASIGAVLGQIVRLPAPLAITAAGAAPAPALRAAMAFSADVPDAVTGTDVDGAPPPPRHKTDPDESDTAASVDTDVPHRNAQPSAAPEPPAVREPTPTETAPEAVESPHTADADEPAEPRSEIRPFLGSPERPLQQATASDDKLGRPDTGPKKSRVTAPDPAAPPSTDDASSPDPAAG